MRASLQPLYVALLPHITSALNFPYESTLLTPADTALFSSIAFPTSNTSLHASTCKSFPGDASWPSIADWNSLNASISGNLLQPQPIGAACYPGPAHDAARCTYLATTGLFSRAYIDDPTTVLSSWPEGDTCVVSLNASGTCEQGGYPVYVVNVTTVRDVQAAVNFARNRHVRLIVKGSGHDFGGRSVGAGSLSIWTHFLKGAEFLPNYSIGEYEGMAIRIGAGTEAWEMFNYMVDYNISVPAPGGSTVGVGGGWVGGGGHGSLTTLYGLGSDQVLSMQVVTADGRFLTADPELNEDLFYALRGGGGGTYGVATSLIMKAYPSLNITSTSLAFRVSSAPLTNTTFPGTVSNSETFWEGARLYYKYAKKIIQEKGVGWGYIYYIRNNSFSFSTSTTFAGKTTAEVFNIMQPLYDDLNRIGINVTNPSFLFSSPYGSRRSASPVSPANTRYRSRLFPRKNWDDDELFNKTMAAIRKAVEAGYDFHPLPYGPSNEIAGYPGSDSGVNPAWRDTLMHASLVTTQPIGMKAQDAKDEETRIQQAMAGIREVTPGSGAYMNEGDPGEPNWQQSFFGDKYGRLLEIKQNRDPWSVFWAQTTVGSEGWEVRSADGYPESQNGRLCRVGKSNAD